jgi:hypothetical protein
MLGLCRTSMSLQHSSKKDAKSPDGIVSIVRSFDLDNGHSITRHCTMVPVPQTTRMLRRLWDDKTQRWPRSYRCRCVHRKLNPNIVVMKSAQDGMQFMMPDR